MKLEFKKETEKLIALGIGWEQHEYPHRMAPEKVTKIVFVFLCWVIEVKITTEYTLLTEGTSGTEIV